MSTRIAITLAVASLFIAVGCATGEDIEGSETESTETASDTADMPELQLGIEEKSTGYNCGCPAGQEMQAGLCYPTCGSGYSGDGPVCWQNCAAGFTDTGWFCQRNSHVTSANTKSCPWYNKCGLGSSCSKCPSGYKNDGCTCRRDAYIYAQPSYGRGAGTVPSCSNY